jgi:hypothetical protein
MSTSGVRKTLLGLEGLTAVGSIAAGVMMIVDPAGPVTMGDDVLEQLGYHSWRTVGLFLIAVVGMSALLAIVAAATRHSLAGLAHLGFAAVMVTWIVVQVLRIGVESALQPVFFGVGVVVAVLAWWGYSKEIRAAFHA